MGKSQEIKKKYLFLDQVMMSTSRRTQDTAATLRNDKGFHKGIEVTVVASTDDKDTA
ncbi:hypothetical protein [Pasteuria penetrans]|uniref:hypothetical protein n=1 Tax=Pasteuria penetrans TaxID=86005 RepID=UPI000FA0091E|nr:hypothetical protein [Pasteuria penetrans]